MKLGLTKTKRILPYALGAIIVLSCLWPPASGLAFLRLPDIGIDYQTMKVNQPEKLIAAGMNNVRMGDTFSMSLSPGNEKIIFKNLRTGEELAYPPEERTTKPQ